MGCFTIAKMYHYSMIVRNIPSASTKISMVPDWGSIPEWVLILEVQGEFTVKIVALETSGGRNGGLKAAP